MKFEHTVFESLSIERGLFDNCVKTHRGYALLLRNWINDAYLNGNSVNEVVKKIKRSNLKIEKIKTGNPLS